MRPDTSSHACGDGMRRHRHPETGNADVPHASAPAGAETESDRPIQYSSVSEKA